MRKLRNNKGETFILGMIAAVIIGSIAVNAPLVLLGKALNKEPTKNTSPDWYKAEILRP